MSNMTICTGPLVILLATRLLGEKDEHENSQWEILASNSICTSRGSHEYWKAKYWDNIESHKFQIFAVTCFVRGRH